MRGRVQALEKMVVSLLNQKDQDQTAAEPGDNMSREAGHEALGQLHISHAGTEQYVGAPHWSDLLKEIEDVKQTLNDDAWVEDADDETWNHSNARSNITFGIPRPVTKDQLIQALHDVGKPEIDRLLPLWFNSADPFLFIIHAPTFVSEYKRFWQDPSASTVMWMALLFSIMSIGVVVGPRSSVVPASSDERAPWMDNKEEKDQCFYAANKYQQLACSAMALADIEKSQPYTLEALMIYAECEFLRRADQHSRVWLLNGLLIRVAMRMGYHRDPSNFPALSPFQGEMRRRVFHVLCMYDTMISFAVGLPTIFRGLEIDVRAPRNLTDKDLSPDMTELPKGRPETEITSALYCIAKSRVCAVFAEAVELSHKVTPPTHSQVMAINKRLDHAYSLIPDRLRVRPKDDCITDTPALVMSRYNIELLYHKTRLLLHRNYLTAGQKDSRFVESRNIALDAAHSLLEHQESVFHACEPGGQLHKVWWYTSCLGTFDYLLAAMVLCLEIHHLQKTDRSSSRIPELLGVVEKAHSLWSNRRGQYKDAARGAAILKTMVEKYSGSYSSTSRGSSPEVNLQGTFFHLDMQKLTPDHLAGSSNAESQEAQTPPSAREELPPQIWGPTGWYSPPEDPALDLSAISSGFDWVCALNCFVTRIQPLIVLLDILGQQLAGPELHGASAELGFRCCERSQRLVR